MWRGDSAVGLSPVRAASNWREIDEPIHRGIAILSSAAIDTKFNAQDQTRPEHRIVVGDDRASDTDEAECPCLQHRLGKIE